MSRSLIAAACLVSLALTGCAGAERAGEAGSGRPLVVATTTQAADLAANVAGKRAEVRSLLPASADPHDHELRPSDAAAIEEASLVLRSGGELDAWVADSLGASDAPVLDLLAQVRTAAAGAESGEGGVQPSAQPEGATAPADGPDDPHWWHDPRNAIMAVEAIRDALVRADPEGRSAYSANADAYTRRLRDLDAALDECLGAIPAAQRRIVTTHDALGHFLDRYDIELVGSVIPARSTLGQPSAGETRELVAAMKEQGVRVIFPEISVDPALERAIADEAGARVGEPLYADTLGPEGSAGETYIGATAANGRAIADGLTGGEAGCDLPE